MRNCDVCGQEISQERLDCLPDTRVCVNCSRGKKKMGFNIYSHSKGTAPELVLINQDDAESVRLAKRANRRSR